MPATPAGHTATHTTHTTHTTHAQHAQRAPRRDARVVLAPSRAQEELLARPLRPEAFAIDDWRDLTPLLPDPAALRRSGREAGFIYLKDFFPQRLSDPVRAMVRAYCHEQGWLVPARGNPPRFVATPGAQLTGRGWDDPRFVELQSRLWASQEFQRLGNDPRLLGVLADLAGRPMWMATTNYAWLKFPGSPQQTTRPHQDSYYLPRAPTLQTVWVPLVDTPLTLGPLAVVQASHRGHAWPHVDNRTNILVAPSTRWTSGAVKAGDCVIFSARTVHCAWSNVSKANVRLSLDIRYEAAPARRTTALRPLR